MKRIGYLYEKIYSLENLELAYKNAIKGKNIYSKNKNTLLLNIQQELINYEYKVSKYSVFTIFDKKERTIYSLPLKDKIIQHAILQVINPIFIKCFISQTYSCIPKRGIHKALREVKKSLNNKDNIYVLKLDIKKYYPSINIETLKIFLRKKFKDRKLLHLLDIILNSHNQGIPIGNYISQYFGNFYLTYFDHYLKETLRLKYYFRYMDDMVIIHNCKKYLHQIKNYIEYYLNNILNLQLSNWQIFLIKTRGIDFVGYVIYPTHIQLRKQIKQNFKNMLQKYPNDKSISSYKGWIIHCNGINLWQKYITHGNIKIDKNASNTILQ
jgi:hypothetical protein